MLRRHRLLPIILVIVGVLWWGTPTAAADDSANCGPRVIAGSRYSPTIESSLCVITSQPGTVAFDSASDSSPTDDDPTCSRSDGSEIPCWQGDYAWYYPSQLYCIRDTLTASAHIWDSHRDRTGNTNGAFYLCRAESTPDDPGVRMWREYPPNTPPRAGHNRENLEHSAMASIELHPPTVGVGAYIYPEHSQYGLIWIVGAPLWLWIDATDDRQWGSHTSVVELNSITLTTTATASHVTYDPGDGSEPIICHNPGTPRPWNPNSPLNQHSPTCEHTFTTTSELGNTQSHYTVTATVTWTIEWHTNNGQAGITTLDLTSTNNPHIHISELRIVAYNNPQPQPT